MAKTQRPVGQRIKNKDVVLGDPDDRPLYRKGNGDLYCMLNKTQHVKVKIKDGRVIGDGYGEDINPEELVTIIN